MRRIQLTLVVAALVAAVAPVPATFIERAYSRGLYPRLQPLVTSASSTVPIALLDVAAAMLMVSVAIAVVRAKRTSGVLYALRRFVVVLIVSAAAVYLWFLLFWGLNYRRVPLEQKLEYDPTRIRRDHALTLARHAVDEVNALAGSASAAASETDALAKAFGDVEARLGTPRGTRLGQPKRSVLEWYFRKAALDGMTDPLFLEIILNPEVLPFERPSVLAHEWAHLAGYADESEANFLAWLTCIHAGPGARYSGWLTAYEHVASALPPDDRRALRAALSPAVVTDLAAAGQRFARSSPRVRAAAQGAYDTYLKANRIEEGIANYNAVVRLMVGTSFDPQWNPQIRPD
jgi:hypothetical protein